MKLPSGRGFLTPFDVQGISDHLFRSHSWVRLILEVDGGRLMQVAEGCLTRACLWKNKNKKKNQNPKNQNPRVLFLACCCSVIFQVTLSWTLAFGSKLTVGLGNVGGGGCGEVVVDGSIFFPAAGFSALQRKAKMFPLVIVTWSEILPREE